MISLRLFLSLLCAGLPFLNAQTPPPKPVDFSFQYQLVAGPGIIPETLVILGKGATLTLKPDAPGKEQDPPTVFRGTLTEGEAQRLEAAIPGKSPTFGPIRPGMPTLWIKTQNKLGPVELRVPHDPDAIAKVGDLVKVIEEISKRLQKKP